VNSNVPNTAVLVPVAKVRDSGSPSPKLRNAMLLISAWENKGLEQKAKYEININTTKPYIKNMKKKKKSMCLQYYK
jgi:hypothetical protein